jgi:hypothetical protein
MTLVADFAHHLFAPAATRNSEPWSDDIWRSHVRLQERSGADWHVTRRVPQADFRRSASAAHTFLEAVELAWLTCSMAPAAGHTQRMLTIPAMDANGFDIEAYFDGDAIRASFGGLEQDFTTVPGAFAWIERALSSSYRLRITSAGGFPCEWVLEPVDAVSANQHDVLASGSQRAFSSFKAKNTVFRQNALPTELEPLVDALSAAPAHP